MQVCQIYGKFKGLKFDVCASLIRRFKLIPILDATKDQISHPILGHRVAFIESDGTNSREE